MSWEKTAIGTLARVVVQTTDTLLPVGGVSAGNSSTTALGGNPLGGARIWDQAACFLQVDNVLTGTWTVEVQGTVMGITQLPLARFAGITLARVSGLLAGTSNLRYGTSALALNNATGLQSMLCPSAVLFDNTSAGGITASVIAVAKTNRGKLPKGTLNRSRVQEGVMFSIPVIGASGHYLADGAQGITQSTIVTLGNTSNGPGGSTTYGILAGLDAVQVWDSQMYWMHVTGCSGLWNIAIQGLLPGSSTHFVTIAGLTNIGAGTSGAGVTKAAFHTTGSYASIRPVRVAFDCQGPSGVSVMIAGSIVYAAKTTRGQRNLR